MTRMSDWAKAISSLEFRELHAPPTGLCRNCGHYFVDHEPPEELGPCAAYPFDCECVGYDEGDATDADDLDLEDAERDFWKAEGGR